MYSPSRATGLTIEFENMSSFYRTLGPALREEFGEPVRKVSVDANLGCPHKNSGGCVFCDEKSFSPAKEFRNISIGEQIREGVRRLQTRIQVDKFLAYFQPGTNTFGPTELLERLYREAMVSPGIVGLAIGTRPDCLPENVLDLLETLSRETWLTLEIGVQSIHDRSLRFLNRGHDFAAVDDAIRRVKRRQIRFGLHLILGIPGETGEDRIVTAERIAEYRPWSIKLHNLHVVKGTKLAQMWEQGLVPLPTLEEYAGYVVDFLERIPPETIIERVAGEVSEDYLLAPDWTARKHAARNAVEREFRNRMETGIR